MEYTAVRYPTKEYRQYRPGSKGLNVHYKAFREQFYGNKAITKRSFRTIHRNPSVGQYTDQRGIPTYAYKIPNGKMYKTTPLMDRIPRGGSVPRVVGSLGDVQGSEFFTEGTYQPPAAPGSTLNSPFLFGKASQRIQDATAQYQAQTGKPVDMKVIQSQPFKDFYTAYLKNTQEYMDAYNYHPEESSGIDELATEQSTTELNAVTKQEEELQLVNPTMQPEATTPAADTQDTPMPDAERRDSFEPEADDYQAHQAQSIYVPSHKRAQITRSQFGSEMMIDYALENQDKGDNPLENGLRIVNPTTDETMITNSGNPQARDSLAPMRESSEVNGAFNNSTEQQKTEEDTTSEFDEGMIRRKGKWTGWADKLRSKRDKEVAVFNAFGTLERKTRMNELANKAMRSKSVKEAAMLEIKDRNNRLIKPVKKARGPLKNFALKGSNLKFEVKPKAVAEAEAGPSQSEGASSSARRSSFESGPKGKKGQPIKATYIDYINKKNIPLSPDAKLHKLTLKELEILVRNWQRENPKKVSLFLKTLTHFSRTSQEIMMKKGP